MSISKPTWPYAALLIEILLCYRKVLFRPAKYAIPWDLRFYHLPLAEFMAKSFREGHLPLWDPFTYCGWPIYAELTTQVFYPPTILAVLSNLMGGHNLLHFLERQLIMHVFLAGVFAYLLLRRLGDRQTRCGVNRAPASTSSARVFASQAQHLGAIDARCLAAALLAGRSRTRRTIRLALAGRARRQPLHVDPERLPRRYRSSLRHHFFPGGLLPVSLQAKVASVAQAIRLRRSLPRCEDSQRSPRPASGPSDLQIQVLPTLQLNRLSVSKYRSDWSGDGGGHPLQALYSLIFPNYWGIFQFAGGTYKLPWNPTFLYLYFGLDRTGARVRRDRLPERTAALCLSSRSPWPACCGCWANTRRSGSPSSTCFRQS